MPKAISAVIFDMNGVLVDDEALHVAAFRSLLSDFGQTIDDQTYRRLCMGRTAVEGMGNLIDHFALPVEVGDGVSRKAGSYRRLAEVGLRGFPGADGLVRSLAARYPLALASSAARAEIDLVLAALALGPFFQVVAGAEDVARGKPDPEIYLLAAERLGVAPAVCLVIEDSAAGVTAAKRAGMSCAAVAHTHPRAELAEADLIVDRLDQIDPAALARERASRSPRSRR